MKFIVAPDKFKGSLTAPEAAEALARGVLRADPGAAVDRAPMADGGEGTVEALVAATGGRFLERDVVGPMGEVVRARFGMLGGGGSAAIEMATASGLMLVPAGRRAPMRATTRGTGELVLAAIEAGATRIVVGIGGSATNDGGAGLAQALGYRLLDADGEELPPGGGALERLDRIEPRGRDPRLDGVEIAVACDVDNPLCGVRGASAVFGPQKGATPEQVVQLDRGLANLARVIGRDLGMAVADLPGAGAAGGLGAGLVAFAGGNLTRGVDTVIEAVGLADRLRGADLCLVAEGMLDGSSAGGKTAVGVARLARSLGCPTLAIAGTIGPGAEAVLSEGIDAYVSICPGPVDFAQAIARAAEFLERAAEQVTRAFLAGRKHRGNA
ncbi:glycerate kinase [Tundrisphaera sp. TA3]|uniref:glycerate kinase n=1 Tax=Tundrisphaera sp. TA3 TaxID=3435775 RepID=UPI003EBE3507